jgi:hypothetical protein
MARNSDSRQLVNEPQALNRRRALRVLGALAAAAAGGAAAAALRPEAASAYQQTEPSTQFTGPIESTGSNTTNPAGATVIGNNTASGVGVYGTTNGAAGTQEIPAGVYGVSAPNGQGVYGECLGGLGVWGLTNTGIGVLAEATTGYGVYAVSGTGIAITGATSSNSSSAVEAFNQGTASGVLGASNGGIGVWGVTTNSGQGLANPAVAGSNNGGGAGLVGFTAGPGSIGLGGATDVGIGAYGSSQTGIGVSGYSNTGVAVGGTSIGGGFAGYFNGPVYILGTLTATGAKSAAVRANGDLRRVYSLESPESWFEDFGSGQLTAGQAIVSLEPGFASIVHTGGYRVFLTPQGDCRGLYINNKSGESFSVHEVQGGTSNVAFDYRIVAKRADIEGARLEHVDPPQPPDGPKEPVLDHAPKPPPDQASAPLQVPGAGGLAPGR